MLENVKSRCGIANAITVYDEEIKSYIEDCKDDLIASGVAKELIEQEKAGVVTAVTFYVKALLGNDRTDTDRYMELYRKKVFRLTLEEPEVAPVQPDKGESDDVE